MQLEPYLPISLPPDIPDRIGSHLPQLMSGLVNVLASVAGLVLGISWVLSATGELVASRRGSFVPGSLAAPEEVAETIVRNANPVAKEAQKSSAPRDPKLAIIHSGIGVSKHIFFKLSWSIFKLLIVFLIVKLLFAVAEYVPRFVQETTQTQFFVQIPSPSPLYFVIGLFITADLLIALSVVTTRRLPLAPKYRSIKARGSMHPRFLVSLFEESATLAISYGALSQTKWRLTMVDDDLCYASLVETVHSMSRPWARMVVYPAIMLSVAATVTGFYTLMHLEFNGTFHSIKQFASEAGLAFSVRLIFLIGLILLGSHLAHWTEMLVQWTGWNSTVILFAVWPEDVTLTRAMHPLQILSSHTDKRGSMWILQNSSQKDSMKTYVPDVRDFTVAFFWSSAYSESSNPAGVRTLVGSSPYEIPEDRVESIIEAPFMADFERVLEENN